MVSRTSDQYVLAYTTNDGQSGTIGYLDARYTSLEDALAVQQDADRKNQQTKDGYILDVSQAQLAQKQGQPLPPHNKPMMTVIGLSFDPVSGQFQTKASPAPFPAGLLPEWPADTRTQSAGDGTQIRAAGPGPAAPNLDALTSGLRMMMALMQKITDDLAAIKVMLSKP